MRPSLAVFAHMHPRIRWRMMAAGAHAAGVLRVAKREESGDDSAIRAGRLYPALFAGW